MFTFNNSVILTVLLICHCIPDNICLTSVHHSSDVFIFFPKPKNDLIVLVLQAGFVSFFASLFIQRVKLVTENGNKASVYSLHTSSHTLYF